MVFLDALTIVVGYAIAYAGVSFYNEGPAKVNWTAIAPDTWWGPAEKQASPDTAIYRTNITFVDEMIEDLRWRLNNHQTLVKPLEGIGFEYGFNTDQVKNWTKYWAEQYDFKASEKEFNKYPMYKTNIQGLDIFYVKVTPDTDKEKIPLLMLHGWPSSIKDFWDAIPLLTEDNEERDFAVEVIIPCLPGYGWSETAVRPGLGLIESAVIFRNLMKRLGYEKWYIQGGDLGGNIQSHMATLYPDEILGYHTNFGVIITPFNALLQILGQLNPRLLVEPALENRMYPIYDIFSSSMTFLGYLHEQATKPDTISIPMVDSPTALLVYTFEKFGDPTRLDLADGGLPQTYDPKFLIDNLMVYWTTKTATTAARMYAETFNKKQYKHRLEEIPSPVPTWVCQAPKEFGYQPPAILKLKYPNLVNVTVLETGGHFLAAEKPKEFSADVLKALQAFRQIHKNQA